MKLRANMISTTAFIMLALGSVVPACAALDIGDIVPKFSAPAALDGKIVNYSLAEALARGPVVLYFFPAAFSTGCSIEAHAFAEAIDRFAALGTTVVGVSTDDLETLSKFSSQVCNGRFPVVSDENKAISTSFDALMQTRPNYANRISYVILPNGTVASYYQNLEPSRHIEKMLAAVKALPQNRDKK